MRARIELHTDGEPIDLVELHAWLRRTPSVTSNMQVTFGAGRQSGGMSAGDAIVVAAGAVTALTSVVSAYAAWRSSRSSAPAIVIILEGGERIVVREGSVAELGALPPDGEFPTLPTTSAQPPGDECPLDVQ